MKTQHKVNRFEVTIYEIDILIDRCRFDFAHILVLRILNKSYAHSLEQSAFSNIIKLSLRSTCSMQAVHYTTGSAKARTRGPQALTVT